MCQNVMIIDIASTEILLHVLIDDIVVVAVLVVVVVCVSLTQKKKNNNNKNSFPSTHTSMRITP